jgi:D-alanyl-D-alanine carboxypeptidase
MASGATVTVMTRAPSRCRRSLLAIVGLVVAGLVAGVAPVTSAAAMPTDGGRLTRQQLQREVERTLDDAGYVGLSVLVRDGDHRIRARSGEAELGTGRPVPHRGYLRAGSATKAFVATVALQLVAEGRLSLNDTVEQWLPSVVAGNGNDGTRITIRNLLQHTSGLYNYDYSDDVGSSAQDFERTRFDHVSPDQIVAGAMHSQPNFPPADPTDPEPDWAYSNPNYVLLGMIIEQVTGRSWAQEVDARIVRPLRLTGTYAPGDDPYLPEPHAHTYKQFPGSDTWTDTTTFNMTRADAAGALVSTQEDLDRFFTALLGGRLLPPEQLAEMRRTVPVPEQYQAIFPGLRYGLGLMQEPLTCGGYRWAHHGDGETGTVRLGVTEDGRRSIVVATTSVPTDDQFLQAQAALRHLVDTVLCRGVR